MIKKKNSFTIHGLWPSFTSGYRMADCNTGPEISVSPQGQTLETMNNMWYSVRGSNVKFWNHEYNKHGYCFSQRYHEKDEQPYFTKVVGVFMEHALDQLITHALGDVMIKQDKEVQFTFTELHQLMQNARKDLYFDITCAKKQHKQYINEVRVYFDLEFKPLKYSEKSNCNKSEPIFVTFQEE
jgi:ribonuclease T2